MSQAPSVHPFYRIWFTIIDPAVLFVTVLTCTLKPELILDSVLPASIEPFSQLSHKPLLHQSAALYGFMGIIFAVLLRASPDPKVWKIVQAATLGVDISLLITMYLMLAQQGRLETKAWRGGDLSNIGLTVLVAVIRTAYLMGIGGKGKSLMKKSR